MATPSVRVVGAKANGTTAITPAPNAGHVAGDVELLFVESANEAVSLTTAAGFAALSGGVASVGTAAGSDGTRMTVFWRRWNGTDGSPTVGDSGDHTQAVIISYRDCVSTGNPWEVVQTTTQPTATTAASATGVTTAYANSLIVIAAAQALPDQASGSEVQSGPTNASLTSLGIDYDDTTVSGNGGAMAVFHGTLASPGASGTTTWTSVTSSTRASVTLSLTGVQSVTGSFTANAVRLYRGTPGSLTANAIRLASMPVSSFTTSSVLRKTLNWSYDANAAKLKSQSGFTFRADAAKKKAFESSFLIGNGYLLKRTVSGFAADSFAEPVMANWGDVWSTKIIDAPHFIANAIIDPQKGGWSATWSTQITYTVPGVYGRFIISSMVTKKWWFGPIEDGPPI